MEILLFLGFVGILIWVSSLSKRLTELEARNAIHSIKTTTKKVDQVQNTSNDDFPWEGPVDSHPKVVAQKKHTPLQKKESDFRLEDFLGRKFFAVLGIISIVCAIGFFTLWAFSNGWVGPSGRIAIGILFSLIILGIGEFIRPKYPKFAPVILSAGIAGLLITTFIARNVYGFLTPGQSLFAYSIEVATGLLLALKNNSRLLGNFSIIGGLLAPILVQSPEPNAIGLLTFLSILSVAGFIISTQKKWPEILGILFLGVVSFEIGILDQDLLKDSPLIFLSFIFGLHILFGSGSFYRQLKTKNKSSEISGSAIFEILLFIFSIFSANFLASFIFEAQGWEHFGFFVLFQGFLFFGLADFFKSQGLTIFKNLSIGATLLAILFATIWEIGSDNAFILTLLLTLEGVLFCFAGQSLSERVFEIFGRLAILFALPFFFEINSFGEASFMTLSLLGAIIYAIGKPKAYGEKIWAILSLLFVSFLVLFWSFEILDSEVSNKYEFTLFILPVIWGGLLAFSITKLKNIVAPFLGLIFLGIINIIAWSSFDQYEEDLSNWLTLYIVLAGNFIVLSTFFIQDKALKISASIKKLATILVLSFSTFSLFIFGVENLEEPYRTLLWIFWAGLLFVLGNSKDWPHFRYFGIGIFCFLIAKLYFTDIWQWETWGRFIAFLVLGIALLSISFLYQKKDKNK